MKMKIVLGLGLVASMSLVSCKKDYACVCKSGIVSVEGENYTSVSKKDAESKCSTFEKDIQPFFEGATCSISAK